MSFSENPRGRPDIRKSSLSLYSSPQRFSFFFFFLVCLFLTYIHVNSVYVYILIGGGRPVLRATLCFFFFFSTDDGGRPDVRKCPVPPLPPRDAAGSLWTLFFFFFLNSFIIGIFRSTSCLSFTHSYRSTGGTLSFFQNPRGRPDVRKSGGR